MPWNEKFEKMKWVHLSLPIVSAKETNISFLFDLFNLDYFTWPEGMANDFSPYQSMRLSAYLGEPRFRFYVVIFEAIGTNFEIYDLGYH